MSTVTKEKIRPLGNKIVVKRDEAKERSRGGIIFPDAGKEKPRLGTVISAGPGEICVATGKPVALEVKDGDRIIFSSYAGTEVKLEGEPYLVIDSGDVLAVIEEGNADVD